MTQQIKWCGGSVVLVERYYVDGLQKERYITAIEPKTTKTRLDEVRKTFFTHAWVINNPNSVVKKTSSYKTREPDTVKSKALSTSRTGYRMPKKSDPVIKGKRHILPRPMSDETTPHTQRMMARHKGTKTKKSITYHVDELKTLQENETDISIYKETLTKKISPSKRRELIVSISVLKKENKAILKGKHKSGQDIADDRKKGKIIVTDTEGNIY